MEIIITQWALDSYLDLKSQRVFTDDEYRHEIRRDVLLLNSYPDNIKFKQSKFWSVASEASSNVIAKGYKMKWHQVGQGKVQLRLPVGLFEAAFICAAYVKQNEKQEKRQLAKFKTYLQLIDEDKHIECGRLV